MSASTHSGVTLVLGPPNSGKRGLALEWWQERLDDRPLMVMPSAPDARDMSTEMARRMGGLVGQSAALTFAGLVRLVLDRPCRLVGEFERTVLISQSLRAAPLEALDGVAHLPGVTGAAAKLLQDLGESGRSPEEVRDILERWALAEPEVATLARDMGRIAAEYQDALRRLGLTDLAAGAQEAVAAVHGWRRPVAFCGFTSFTHGQRALVQRLSEETQVLVTLDHDRERDIGICAPGEVKWWIGQAAEILDVSPLTRAYASAAIAHLERHFLSGEAPSMAPSAPGEGESVRFLLSSGRRAEAEAVAEQISRLVAEGFDPGGIAVVVRQVRAWSRLLGDVFASCGLPYQTDERCRLGETGLGYAFLQAVRGVALDDADALLSFLRGPYAGCVADDVCDLETRYRQGVTRGARALALLAHRRMVEFLEPVRALVRSEPTSHGAAAGETARHQFDLAAAGALAERMLLAGARGAGTGSRELEADARAFRALQGALAAMETIAGQVEPQEALGLLVQAGVPGPAHVHSGAVQILSAQRARARRFDVVFVLGLVEGEFPGLSDAPSLLSAGNRAGLDRLAGGLSPPDPEGERTLFLGAATRAWRLLYLSARDAEDDGGEAVPSRFWTECKSLLGAGVGGHGGRTLADQVFAAHSAPSLRHYLRACAVEGLEPDVRALPVRQADTAAVAVGSGAGGQGFSTPAWHRAPARLTSATVLAELQAADCFSPSSLESYTGCPFAWFLNRAVGREELETELDARVLGDLIHGVLSECYRSLAADGLLPLKSEGVPEAERRASALVDKAVEGPDCPGTPAERRVAACRLRGMARGLFQAEAASGGSLAFKQAEVRVGAAEGVDVGGLRVRGRIDRIDTTPDGHGLFVFDYKSGTVPSATAIGTGEGLQLPLYLLALRAERGDAQPLGGAYVSLAESVISGVVSAGREGLLGTRAGRCRTLDAKGWQELADGVLTVAQAAADGMRAGAIAPKADRVCPVWCDLGPACRSRRGGQRP
jgi:ATP-dependent helicase/nuclease subunit B